MKKIILCEGKTDAILISYFLEKFNWQHLKSKKEIPIKITYDEKNELLNWYKNSNKADQELAIWGVGGYDNIQPKLKNVVEIIQSQRNPKDRFNKIVFFVDNDTGDSKKHIFDIEKWIEKSKIYLLNSIQLQEWSSAEVELLGNQQKYPIELLSIILPSEGKGNLEVFLLDALKENSENDRFLVEEAEKFVNKFINNIPDQPGTGSV
ncbi:MAG: DUF3226 domain-containing protein [Snowella sp.]|nr:DUF3226 domain-containing protein [Snowella sp.]